MDTSTNVLLLSTGPLGSEQSASPASAGARLIPRPHNLMSRTNLAGH